MSFFQKFPYTDDHQLNLDWIMRMLIKFKGGQPGDVLSKRSSADYDFIWKHSIGNFEVVESIEDIATVSEKYALVLHNNSDLGDGGPCWFETLDYATVLGYENAAGKHMYPMMDQGPVFNSTPPIRNIWNVMTTYIENPSLVYGQDHNLFSETCTDEIDCSSFICAILNGVPYNASRYYSGNTANNRTVKISDFGISNENTIWAGATYKMAQYFGEHKWLHTMPASANISNTLQFGDILFMDITAADPSTGNRFHKIGHCVMVVGTSPIRSTVTIAEAGGSPIEMTVKRNSATVGKFSTINLTDEFIQKYVPCFARIPYCQEDTEHHIPAYDTAEDGFNIDPIFIPNSFINSVYDGAIDYASNHCTSSGFIQVEPGMSIRRTGALTGDHGNYFMNVAEFDKNLQFLSLSSFRLSSVTFTNDTRYIKVVLSYQNDYPILLSDMTAFGAVIENPMSDNFVIKNQGVAHAGEFCIVGSDGEITTMTMDVWEGGNY